MLPALPQGCQGIPANPDIAGIGIRASTYAQNFIGVFLAACYLTDGEISPDEVEYMEAASNAILMTGCAIIISAFIQAKTIGLSVYHAMIVLNLSWMNNSYLTISWIFTSSMDQTEEQLPAERTPRGQDSRSLSQREAKKKKILRLPISLGLAHLSIMASFGIWLWQDIGTFGDSPECTPSIFTVIFGHNVSAANKSLRRVFLALYWITVIPSLNVFIGAIVAFIVVFVIIAVVTPFIMIIEELFYSYINRRRRKNSNTNKNDDSVDTTPQRESLLLTLSYPALFGVCYLPIVLFLDVALAVNTELMIHRSRPLVQAGESQWTFGQTLAVIVTIIPVIEARKCIKWWRRHKEPHPSRSQTKNISLDYQGDTLLTVHPPIDGSTTITKGSTTAILSNSEPYKFSANGSVVATIHNHDDNNEVKIAGGGMEGTEIFTLTVPLKRAPC